MANTTFIDDLDIELIISGIRFEKDFKGVETKNQLLENQKKREDMVKKLKEQLTPQSIPNVPKDYPLSSELEQRLYGTKVEHETEIDKIDLNYRAPENKKYNFNNFQ